MSMAALSGRQRAWWHRTWVGMVVGLRRALLCEDQPGRLARGSAAGIFASALPIVGQTFIGLALARLMNGNLIASIPWSWISNPLTTMPIWYAGYLIGVAVIPGQDSPISYRDLVHVAGRMADAGIVDGLRMMVDILGGLLLPLWVGCSVLGLAMAIPGYALVLWITRALQARRIRLRESWAKRLASSPSTVPSTDSDGVH